MKIFLLQYETGQINNITGKYTRELSKLKHLQHLITTFELDYRTFKKLPQWHQLSTVIQLTIEEVFENL